MENDGLSLYCGLMDEVKKRTEIIWAIQKGEFSLLYKAVNLEVICLQIRKILELVALGSLVTNKDEFSKQHDKFSSYWHAGKIINDIESVNPDFYPRPIKEEKSTMTGISTNITDLQDGYLTKDEFVKVYEKCGKIAHAENPYGSKIDYSYYEQNVSIWFSKIKVLLNSHIMKLVDQNCFYLIHMQEERDDKTRGYLFSKN